MLNQRAHQLCKSIRRDAGELRIEVTTLPCGATVIDCGVKSRGGLEAGRRLAEVCLAGLGEVQIVPHGDYPAIAFRTDHPVAACMASQYAGWEVKGEKFFAMGSGPMRAAAGREELFNDIGLRESADVAVGVLEADKLPPDAVAMEIAQKCNVRPEGLTLLVAPTTSQAGTVQVVARSIETALHKLHELKFDLHRVESGWGIAPLPPVSADFLSAIGRTNDAILYGGHALLYVRGDDESLQVVGPQTPSSASLDHGRPFKEIFAAAGNDFYKIDRALFSPAVVTFVNLDTGHTFRFGKFEPAVLEASFH
ncbi:MAG: methenyltetrahydromethanopterin cyclohydrolase [Pirellulales bacterium]